MWPLTAPLEVGLRPCLVAELRRGDIVAFLAESGVLWLHRVVRVAGETVITRGDTNGYDDAPVPHTALLGRAEAIRWRGVVVAWPLGPASGDLVRRAGLAWSRVAPGLRRRVARVRQGAKRGVDP